MKRPNEYLADAQASLGYAKQDHSDDQKRQMFASVAIAEALTGLLELFIGLTADNNSVLDVRMHKR